MKGRKRIALALLASVAVVLAATQLASGAGGSNVRVIATGLNNPRGVEVAPDGSVFVAQAGVAGTRCDKEGCVGFTGAIDRIANGQRVRWAAGFFSLGGRDGSFAVGMDDVAISPGGTVYGIQTTPGPRPEALGPAIAAQAGYVLRVDHGRKTPVSDRVSAYEFDHNPAHDNVDSNPYSVAWSPLGFAVADAAGNSLLLVNPSGRVTTLATFPAHFLGGHPNQSVPTSVVWHDGAFYVGELGGGGAPPGHARVWKVVPGQGQSVYATGFSAITGIAFGPDGSLWVTELARGGLAAAEQNHDFGGALIRVRPNGHRNEYARGRLIAPAGTAVGPDGTVYVSNFSVFRGKGQLVAITPAA